MILEAKKLDSPFHVEAVGENVSSKRFHNHESNPNFHFLIDTDAEISTILITDRDARPAGLRMSVTNNTLIETFGRNKLVLDIQIKRPIAWDFCIAAVLTSIIRADVLNR